MIRSFILKKIKPFLYFNRLLVCLTIFAQIFSLIYFILSASNVSTWIQRGLMLFSILMALFIISKHEKSGFKIIWILLIMIFPLFGGFTYLIFHGQGATRKFRKTLTKLEEKTRQTFLLTSPAFEQAILKNPEYHNNISYLEKYDIIKGYSDKTFRPDDYVSRAEFVAMTVRYYDLFNDVTFGATTKKYTDVTTNYWAVKEISYAKNIGWLNGYADGTFRGDNNITRAEVVAVVNRATGRSADEDYINKNFTKLNRFTDVNDSSKWYFADINEAANEHIGITTSEGETWTK